jgi:polar amino acid transport system permease protein
VSDQSERVQITEEEGAGGSRWKKRLARAPWWVSLVILIALLFIYAVLTNSGYRETFNIMVFGRPEAEATEGVVLTIRITLIAFAIATVLGLIAGLARVSSSIILNNIATFYVEIVRGVPLVVLILYFAFVLLPIVIDLLAGLGNRLNLDFLANLNLRNVSFEARAIIALAFGYGAYEAEVFRAGIQSIEHGQMEAARSLGMTYFQAMRYVILPQAIRRVLPPLGNDFIALLKDSSLATVLAVPELTQLGRIQRSSTFRVFEVFNTVAVMYLSMTLLLSLGVRMLERRLSSGRPSSTIR